MKFSAVVEQVLELLQRQGRISYRALKREFDLDDAYLDDLKAELIDARRLASDEDGKVLVWAGGATVARAQSSGVSSSQPPAPQTADSGLRTPDSKPQTLDSSAERRQLTVMFCDLVGSTALSEQLDPEEYREVVRAYHETCADVSSRYAGHTAQHLGDGLLVYFGYPAAHEDDAQRAVRTGLEILAGLQPLNARLPATIKARLPHPIQVRIGVHTGLVVIGEIGSGEKREILALGETPNLAARIQGQAEPDTVVISGATHRLVQGLFECQDRGPQELKGISTPLPLYHVVGESAAQSRFEATLTTGLTPLIGRSEELALLWRHWERAKEGDGQVVLLSGEPGIGKSRLAQELKERISQKGAPRIEFRCSPYHQNSALYPIIEHWQRLLQFHREEAPHTKLAKLQQALSQYRFPQADTTPLLAALLSLPHPQDCAPLTLSPQKQKQKTQEALVAWIIEEAEKAPVYCAWEDLHWADPSTLELLTLCLEQIPTTRVFTILTFRPDFTPPWGARSYLTPLTLSRLGRPEVEAMVEQVTRGKALPAEVVRQIVAKTDGVPLFVEELTKTVLESVESIESIESMGSGGRLSRSALPLGIPATLQDALMARLDRLGTIKEVAQLGATLGREFFYEVLQAVSPLGQVNLQQGLAKLVEAEVLYQRGLLPQAWYVFKHALIQDVAYQSLLKSKRQQYHNQIAQVLEERFPEIKETQPELLAYHYTEAGLSSQAIAYWQQAGQRAIGHSANIEAISHLTKGLEVLKTLPDTPERAQQELFLQTALGPVLIATKGNGAPEVEKTYAQALELCRQMGETPQLFPVLFGLRSFYMVRAELQTAHELGEQLLRLAQSVQDSDLLLEAHVALANTFFWLGEFVSVREHSEQGLALYDPQKHRSHALLYGLDPGVLCLCRTAQALRYVGYPDQALKRVRDALTLAQELAHPVSLACALWFTAAFHRKEGQAAQEQAEALIALSREQGFPVWLALGTISRGSALAEQGQGAEGIAQMRQGLAALRAMGAEIGRSYYLSLLVEGYGKVGQAEEGLSVLAEALAIVDKTGERWWEAELYRLKGQLVLQSGVRSPKSEMTNPQPLIPNPQAEAEAEAEECFQRAIEIARRQQAKFLELRAVMSLSRLWQQQGKRKEAHEMLAEIYGWFTEGFDTKDLQDAKALLDELS